MTFKSIIFFILLMVIVGCSEDTAPPVGQEGILDSVNELIPIAIDENALDEWTKARMANDNYGQMLMLAGGKISTVEKGIRVLVIDRGSMIRKIRIKEGKKVGLSGWVPMERVKYP